MARQAPRQAWERDTRAAYLQDRADDRKAARIRREAGFSYRFDPSTGEFEWRWHVALHARNQLREGQRQRSRARLMSRTREPAVVRRAYGELPMT